MKSEYLSKPAPGFNVKSYAKQIGKTTDKFKRNSKVVKISAIESRDQRSSNEYNTRVSTVKLKPKSMTWGGSKAGKGVTIYKKGKA